MSKWTRKIKALFYAGSDSECLLGSVTKTAWVRTESVINLKRNIIILIVAPLDSLTVYELQGGNDHLSET